MALEKEETAQRTEEQRTKSFRAPPRRHCPPARAPKASKLDPGAKSRTCAAAASRAAAASSDNHLEEDLKGQVEQGEFFQHMWIQQKQMQQALPAAGDCTDGCHSATRGNAVRGDAAKHLASVVRDGSATEGRRLTDNLWCGNICRTRKRLS